MTSGPRTCRSASAQPVCSSLTRRPREGARGLLGTCANQTQLSSGRPEVQGLKCRKTREAGIVALCLSGGYRMLLMETREVKPLLFWC